MSLQKDNRDTDFLQSKLVLVISSYYNCAENYLNFFGYPFIVQYIDSARD